MISRWARQTAVLRGELVALAGLPDPRWWLLAGGAAVAWPARGGYLASDAEPAADTFIGHVAAPPADPAADAVARAHAARDAIRALDGTLPDQPLAVTIRRTAAGAILVPSALEVAAFAIGERCWCARLASRLDDDAPLAGDLARVLAGGSPQLLVPLGAGPTPFVTVTLGDEPLETARHGHRRGWIENGVAAGPWLGVSRAGGMGIVSTCHLVVDGYGHARLAALVAKGPGVQGPRVQASDSSVPSPRPLGPSAPGPLPLAWRELPAPAPRALALAYATGRLVHRLAGRPGAPCSPSLQIPVAPGAPDDPRRRARRVVPALASVQHDGGIAEPFERFAARARASIAREADGSGLVSCLLAAARAAPAPLAWKRRAVASARPRWLAAIADVLGGRACVSRIALDAPSPAACAVSSPAQPDGLVITLVDDGARAGLTVCGAGASAALIDELLALLPG